MDRILLTGTGSGCGKTTVTCALLSALKKRGLDIVSFKCGPDYIDPMFHRELSGIKSYNLDPFFCDETTLIQAVSSKSGDIAVLEGAMGYYDGIGTTDTASAYTVAAATKTPAILVVNAKSTGNSIGAVIKGFAEFKENSGIEGVIFNNVSKARYDGMKRLAQAQRLTPLGYLPYDKSLNIESRHLGLITAGEIEDLKERLDLLGETALETLDIDGILALASTVAELEAEKTVEGLINAEGATIAVSRDEAFCFLYRENIELLESMGCEIVYFSPMKDKELPQGTIGLYLCGGYPELYLERLSKNVSLLESIKKAVKDGMPTIAECGGFMYLHEYIGDFPMVGVIEGKAFKTERLQRFGYTKLTAKSENLLCGKGEGFPVHEFHYWDSDNVGEDFVAKKAGKDLTYKCVHSTDSLYAGFPHLYFPSKPEMAVRFAQKSQEYGGSK